MSLNQDPKQNNKIKYKNTQNKTYYNKHIQ